jgi:hypothetical protein
MLGDQESPYVGRFARGWHRLPERIPGQPQTRTWARLRIGTTGAPPQRGGPPVVGKPVRDTDGPSCGHQVDPAGSHGGQRFGARTGGRSGGEDVVHQEDPRWRHTGPDECAPHRFPPLPAPTLSLRTRRDRPPQHPADRDAGPPTDPDGERTSLVVAAFGQTTPRKWYPGNDVDGGKLVARDERVGQRRGDVTPPGEFQPVHGRSGGPLEQERGSGRRDRRWRTVAAGGNGDRRRATTAGAPGSLQRDQSPAAYGAERPRPTPTSGAPPREDDVERAGEHAATVAPAADTAMGGRPPSATRRAR